MPEDFYPESIAVTHEGNFYISSWRQGSIARLKAGKEKANGFVPPGSNGLSNTQGVLVDRLFRVAFKAIDEPDRIETARFPRPLKNADAIRFLNHKQLLIFESNAFAKNDPLDGSISLATLHDDGTASLDTFVNGLAAPSSGIVYQG